MGIGCDIGVKEERETWGRLNIEYEGMCGVTGVPSQMADVSGGEGDVSGDGGVHGWARALKGDFRAFVDKGLQTFSIGSSRPFPMSLY